MNQPKQALSPSELKEMKQRLALAIAAVEDTLAVFEQHDIDALKGHEHVRYARLVGALYGLKCVARRGGKL